ncbi:short-chain dehydrogenases/reductase, putative [Talaromyces stipitatus ATCC 10500]|uniref:Short-chain dehydrogenases/reductase, putative n=1 Tax=Talaromyces stipitatus (strain ATCC 10500 / CBS 375.48 / QM 6759 / NRRL 1006) TaxID=441959 RepID=B8MMA2_TALSN|nr:short-chain dehydrogenases/reductase, putative [Talaromyces stipitatus ATCC 10500]EED13656.1 short-chain dehydrogenases/reductase, putative [Talaromyces stipitatus ATCC 10500]
METVLVVGATGNIGVAAILGALRAKRNVLAIVRNQVSADKLFQHVRSKDGITIVEADIMAEEGVQGVVEQVRAGKLPTFQHVYAAAGGAYGVTPLRDLSTSELRKFMSINFESNFLAYSATIPYLLEQSSSTSFTLCTGSQGDIGARAAPAITQGPLYSMANVACRDNENTNVRFNEVYLATRVEVDSVAEKTGAMKTSDFANVYNELLSRPDIKSSRITVATKNDLKDLKYKKKIDH